MKKIALISDTHSYIDDSILQHCKEADEIWHAGDIGSFEVVEALEQTGKTLRMVYGNIDGQKFRRSFPLDLHFNIEGLQVYITHIGGYPGKMYNRVITQIKKEKPGLYVCGHSHICKVMPDQKHNLLHMNPGACGQFGFHKIRTILLFEVSKGKIENLRVVELGMRGRL